MGVERVPLPCPACSGVLNRPCGICGGAGYVEDTPAELDERTAAAVHEFLRAWGLVEKHGPEGALVMLGIRRRGFDPRFIEACEVFDAEMAEMEQAAEVEEAEQRRRREKAQRR